MKLFQVDQQINLQYLTQLLLNDGFEMKRYQRRNHLLNTNDLSARELLNLFRQFQSSYKATTLNSNQNPSALPSSMEEEIDEYSQKGWPQQREQSYYNKVRIVLSDSEEVEFSASMQKYPFRNQEYSLERYRSLASNQILSRVIFLSVSGYIGFDDSERATILKVAFLLEFDSLFEFASRNQYGFSDELLRFKDNSDEAIDVISFMWQVNIQTSTRFYNFITRLAELNPHFYKHHGGISPRILSLDITLIETQLLPLVERILSKDKSVSEKEIQLTLRQIIEFYEINNSRKIVYPLVIQNISPEKVALQVDKNYSNILKEFECPICFLDFQDCYTTLCGHSFCKTCIEQSVIKFKNCPMCQSQLTEFDIFRNFHLIQIKECTLKQIEEEKEFEISRLKSINQFKDTFQKKMHSNIIKKLRKDVNNKENLKQVVLLKKQIQYLVNITFDSMMQQLYIQE